MKRSGDRARTFVSAGTALLMLSLSIAVPLLERADVVTAPVAESEHNPATCPPAHDHTVCTQVGSNLAAPAPAHEHRLTRVVLQTATPSDAVPATATAFPEGHPTRAPPRV